MSGETEQTPSGWTVDTGLAYLSGRIAALDERVKVEFEQRDRNIISALTTAKEAVGKAEVAAEKRFDSVNEFRGQLADQANTFLPRIEGEQRMEQLGDKFDRLDARFAQSLNLLDQRIGRIEERRAALSAGYGYLVGAIGMISALVAIAVALSRG